MHHEAHSITYSHNNTMLYLKTCTHMPPLTTSVAHRLIGNKAIWCKHVVGFSVTVKAHARTVGYNYNLIMAAEGKEQAHMSHMTNM